VWWQRFSLLKREITALEISPYLKERSLRWRFLPTEKRDHCVGDFSLLKREITALEIE